MVFGEEKGNISFLIIFSTLGTGQNLPVQNACGQGLFMSSSNGASTLV